jgi:single-strand DNA-binding protein
MSINKAILVGNVGKEPEIRYFEKDTNSDKNNAIASFTLATTERGYTLANGTQVPERTEWHNIVAWRGLATLTEQYIHKGTQIYVEGKITTRRWEKDGVTRYTTEILADNIQLLGGKRDGAQPVQESGKTTEPEFSSAPSRASQQPGFVNSDGTDGADDLPF